MITTPDQQGADDLNAFNDWEDGEGAECATTSGVWFAALAYERARVEKIDEELQAKEARWFNAFSFIYIGIWIAVMLEAFWLCS